METTLFNWRTKQEDYVKLESITDFSDYLMNQLEEICKAYIKSIYVKN